jgi:hypothetical protein
VDRSQTITLDGLNGAQARVSIERVADPGDRFPEGRTVEFEINLTNSGERPIGVELEGASWLTLYGSDTIRPDRLSGPLPSLNPHFLTVLTLEFKVPVDARMVRLHVGVPMDGGEPGADWNL